jgi:hypothetical protein
LLPNLLLRLNTHWYSEAYKDYVWLKGLYDELCGDDACINLFCDSQIAIYLTKGQIFHGRSKHIDVKYHYMIDIVAQGKLKVCKNSTHNNHVDDDKVSFSCYVCTLLELISYNCIALVVVWHRKCFFICSEIVKVF